MNEKIELKKGAITGIASWAFLLCIAWFGCFNNWWPIAFPIVFTVIIGTLYAIALIASIILFILKLTE